MKIEIEIRDRLYRDLLVLCEENSITIENYILDCIEDTYNLLKYGDLNEIINGKNKEVVVEKVNETKKRVGRPPKKKAEEEEVKIIEEKNESDVLDEKPLKIKKIRTLKTK